MTASVPLSWLCPYCGVVVAPDALVRADEAPYATDVPYWPAGTHAIDCPNYWPNPQPVPYGTAVI